MPKISGTQGVNSAFKFRVGALVKAPPLVTLADPITWLSDSPIWVDQWCLMGEKLIVAQQLVEEQLKAHHIQPAMSPWNTPIFVIKKKSGKW